MRRLALITTLCAAAVILVTGLSPLGTTMNELVVYRAALKLRAALGWESALSQDFRVVLFEDRSLEKLGRPLTPHEWRAIGTKLGAMGVGTVVLLGRHEFDREVAPPPERSTERFIVGAAGLEADEGAGSIAAEDVPPALTLNAGTGVLAPAEVRPFAFVLGVPRDRDWRIDGVGLLNLASATRVTPVFALRDGRKLPYLGAAIADNLAGQPEEAYVDFISSASVRERALPATAFFHVPSKTLADVVAANVASKLAGARVVFLVPDAYTGSRFVDTPTGQRLAFHVVLSVANAIWEKRTLHSTTPSPLWALLLVIPALLTAFVRRHRVALGATGIYLTLATVAAITSAAAGIAFAPLAEVILGLMVVLAIRGAVATADSLLERARLTADLALGSAVQELLLPEALNGEAAGVEYGARFQPFGPMSGDWILLDGSPASSSATFAIGDVIGKGPSAALITATINSVWCMQRRRRESGLEASVDELITLLDDTIIDAFRGSQTTSLSIARVEAGRIRLATCGAPRWLHIDGITGKATSIRTTPSDPLGLRERGRPWSWHEAPLKPGDVYVAYTDGILESARSVTKLCQHLTANAWAEIQTGELVETIFAQAVKAGAGLVQPDDRTLLVLRVPAQSDQRKGRTDAA